jgi:16S rRNA processing protein RimM
MSSGGRVENAALRSSGPARRGLIELGRIVNLHGVRGEVRVLPYNPDSDLLQRVRSVILSAPNATQEQHAIVGARPHKRFVLLRLRGIDSASDAERLIGRAVCIPAADLPAPGPGEHYHHDLIGCAVRTDRGEDVGVVEEMMAMASNDVCVVRGRGREHLIPLVADVVAEIDVAARVIVIHPIPGLLDP